MAALRRERAVKLNPYPLELTSVSALKNMDLDTLLGSFTDPNALKKLGSKGVLIILIKRNQDINERYHAGISAKEHRHIVQAELFFLDKLLRNRIFFNFLKDASKTPIPDKTPTETLDNLIQLYENLLKNLRIEERREAAPSPTYATATVTKGYYEFLNVAFNVDRKGRGNHNSSSSADLSETQCQVHTA